MCKNKVCKVCITLFVWESDDRELFPKLNLKQFMNRDVKILSRRLYSPSLKNVGSIEDAQFIFLIFLSINLP